LRHFHHLDDEPSFCPFNVKAVAAIIDPSNFVLLRVAEKIGMLEGCSRPDHIDCMTQP
jgi:hypothetical protein